MMLYTRDPEIETVHLDGGAPWTKRFAPCNLTGANDVRYIYQGQDGRKTNLAGCVMACPLVASSWKHNGLSMKLFKHVEI